MRSGVLLALLLPGLSIPLAVVACGGDSASNGNTAVTEDPDASPPTEAGAPGDATDAEDAVTDAAGCLDLAAIDLAASKVAMEPDDKLHEGYVLVGQTRNDNGAYVGGMTGRFFAYPPDAGEAGIPPCIETTIAHCTLRACELKDAGVRPDPAVPSAGDLILTGPSIPASLAKVRCGSLVVSPPEYVNGGGSVKLYEPGENLTVRASGDPNGVPPFTVSFVGAAQVETTTPVLGGYDDPTVVSKSTGGTMSWSPAGPGIVEVEIVGLSSSGTSDRLTCRGEGSTGTMTIPKEALATWQTTAAGGRTGGIYVRAQTTKSIVAGKYRIRFEAKTSELSGWYRLGD